MSSITHSAYRIMSGSHVIGYVSVASDNPVPATAARFAAYREFGYGIAPIIARYVETNEIVATVGAFLRRMHDKPNTVEGRALESVEPPNEP